jgi:hypothetical protein
MKSKGAIGRLKFLRVRGGERHPWSSASCRAKSGIDSALWIVTVTFVRITTGNYDAGPSGPSISRLSRSRGTLPGQVPFDGCVFREKIRQK